MGRRYLIGQLTAGQDVKIIKDLGLAASSVFGLFIAVFIGVGLVWKEVDRRSVYNLLVKPLRRYAFIIGMVLLLEAQDARFQANVVESGAPEPYTTNHLRVSSLVWGNVGAATGWFGGYGEQDWYTSDLAVQRVKANLAYCNTHGLSQTVLGFGWCWDATWHNLPGGGVDPVYQVRWAGASLGGPDGDLRWGLDAEDTALTGNRICMDTYLNATQQYVDFCKSNGYPTKVVFTTGPIDSYIGENGYQRQLKYERMRQYVVNSADNILFDYADILSWNNAGQRYTRTWTDYGGRVQTYSMIHPDNMIDLNGSYVEDGDHIGQVGAIRLAKALWVMLAHLALVDSTPPSSPAPLVGTVVGATTVGLTWSVSTDASGAVNYEVYRDGALVGMTGSPSYVDGGRAPDATYAYAVRAVDFSGNWSESTATVTLSAAPSYVLTVGGVNGSVQRTPDQATYQAGQTVVLTAVAIGGYVFDHWEGDLGGNSNPVSVLIQGNATVTAVFAEQPPLANGGLGGYWAMDEGSGTVVADASGQGNHGVLQSGATWAPGVSGWGVSFDGVNDYVNLGTNAFGISNAFTMSLWFKATVLANRYMVLAERGPYVYPFILRMNSGVLQVGLRAGSSVTYLSSAKLLVPDTWYHVAVTYGAGQGIIYINGQEDRRGTVTGLLNMGSGAVTTLAATPLAASPFSGVIDAVRIYSRALSAGEVLWLHGQDLGLEHPPQDTTPPAVVGISLAQGGVAVAFSEPLDGVSGGLLANYAFVPSLSLAAATVQGAVVHLSVISIPDGAYELGVQGVADLAGNVMLPVVVPLVIDQTPPSSPAPLVGTVVGATTVGLTWSVSTDASGAVNYEVYRDGALVGMTGSPSYVDGGRAPGATYAYAVRAVDFSGNWSESTATVTLSAAPSYVLTVGGVNGSVQRTPDQATYQAGQTVVLTAVAIGGYVFDHWEGDLGGNSNPVSVLIQGNATVTAVFAEQPPLANGGLGGYWAMDEGSGTVVADASGQGNHGVLQSGATWAPGVSGWGVSFDGVNDYVNLGTNAFGISNAFTVSLWFKATVLANRYMVLAERGPYVYPFILRMDSGVLRVGLRAGSSVTYLSSAKLLMPDTWYHVAVTYGAGQGIIYINGQEDRRGTVTGLLNMGSGAVTTLAATPLAASPFSGVIDAVRIYSRALSAGEVLSLHDQDLGLEHPPQDTTPPAVVGISLAQGGVAVAFSEPLDGVSGGLLANYAFVPSLSLAAATVQGAVVHLSVISIRMGHMSCGCKAWRIWPGT